MRKPPNRRATREQLLEIVGIEGAEGVHTIDLWFSTRRRCWIVERRDRDGGVIGPSYCAQHEDDAIACLVEWLRTHGETHLVGRILPPKRDTADRRIDRAA